jgi:hypothetical protein
MSKEKEQFSGGGCIFSLPLEQDWDFMGANTPTKRVIFPDSKQMSYLSEGEHQYTRFFDPWSCVSNSATDCIEGVLNRMMQLDASIKPILESLGVLNETGHAQFSFRALAVMSGTKPGQGNSQRAVAETARTMGLVGESVWPSDDSLTQSEWYKPVPQEVLDKAKLFLKYFDIFHENIKWGYLTGVANHNDLLDALKYGAVQACVGSPYEYSNNIVVGSVNDSGAIHNYNHAVRMTEHNAPNDDIRDSYEPFDKKFACAYALGTPKLFYLSKKEPFTLVKEVGKPMFYIMCNSSGNLYRVNDGREIPGGDIVKTLTGGVYSKPLVLESIDQSKVKDLISNI